jgi:hypothetical protein
MHPGLRVCRGAVSRRSLPGALRGVRRGRALPRGRILSTGRARRRRRRVPHGLGVRFGHLCVGHVRPRLRGRPVRGRLHMHRARREPLLPQSLRSGRGVPPNHRLRARRAGPRRLSASPRGRGRGRGVRERRRVRGAGAAVRRGPMSCLVSRRRRLRRGVALPSAVRRHARVRTDRRDAALGRVWVGGGVRERTLCRRPLFRTLCGRLRPAGAVRQRLTRPDGAESVVRPDLRAGRRLSCNDPLSSRRCGDPRVLLTARTAPHPAKVPLRGNRGSYADDEAMDRGRLGRVGMRLR